MKVEILKSQKSIYNHMKKRALDFEDSNHKHIALYRRNYQKACNRPFTSSTMIELNKKILLSNFIFVGDFHTFDHCLKNLLRILKLLVSKKRKVILALEMISNQDFQLLESFLQGHITELEFLQSINLGHSWKFPWTHYRSIYEFVKMNPLIEIIGVNTVGTLDKRDSFCAELLADKYEKNQNKTFIILYGEYHIAPNKIPQKLMNLTQNKTKQLILHQNLDAPYWKIVNKKRTISEQMVIKYNAHEFCLLSSPPWMKYESMCYWYENLYDDPEFDLHQYIIENGLKLLSTNTVDNFTFLGKQIILLFKLQLKAEDLSFNLYDFTKYDFLQKYIKKVFKNKKAHSFVGQLIETQHMLIIPGSDKIYCASYSSNKMAKLAGGFLYLEFCKQLGQTHNAHLILERFNKLECFSYFFLYHFHAYFMAKAINPYLKCDLYGDHLLKSKKTKSSALIIALFKNIPNNKKVLSSVSIYSLFELAKTVGELCAESHFIFYQNNSKSFNANKWKSSFLSLTPEIENISLILHKTTQIAGFKYLKKRYY